MQNGGSLIPAYLDFILLRKLAEMRAQLHRNHASSRPLSEDYEFIGMVGEGEFAAAFRLPMDLTVKADGDKGIDFRTKAGTVDVKTYRKAFNLAVEVGKANADIYVLARYDDASRRAELIGWEYGRVMRDCPVHDFGKGIKNHVKPANRLRKMVELRMLLAGEAK